MSCLEALVLEGEKSQKLSRFELCFQFHCDCCFFEKSDFFAYHSILQVNTSSKKYLQVKSSTSAGEKNK